MSGTSDAAPSQDVVISRLPRRLQPPARWMLSNWPGRILLGFLAGSVRLELFDRAMVIAAQLFTSIFPILIMVSVWAGQGASDRIGAAVAMPPESSDVLEQALDQSGSAAFGLVGAVVVLVSATSLSRALTRAMATIWSLPRPRTQITDAWRWVAVVVVLALSIVLAHAAARFTDPLLVRASGLGLIFALDVVIGAFVPWLLLSGKIQVCRLLPGSVAFALTMLLIRPASAAVLPRVLADSAERYGTIGVAFSYLTWLYVVSFAFLATAILGQVLAGDRGVLGRFTRGGGPAAPTGPERPVGRGGRGFDPSTG